MMIEEILTWLVVWLRRVALQLITLKLMLRLNWSLILQIRLVSKCLWRRDSTLHLSYTYIISQLFLVHSSLYFHLRASSCCRPRRWSINRILALIMSSIGTTHLQRRLIIYQRRIINFKTIECLVKHWRYFRCPFLSQMPLLFSR
jgi:hypothetical protein